MKSNCRAPVSTNTTTTSAKLILLLLLRLFLHFNGHFPDGYGLARSDSSPVSPRHSLLVCTQYLMNCCHPTSGVASRQRVRSSSRHHLIVPRHRRSTLGRRAFSVAGPMAWNALPDDLRDPSLSADNFRKGLKTQRICFGMHLDTRRIRGVA